MFLNTPVTCAVCGKQSEKAKDFWRLDLKHYKAEQLINVQGRYLSTYICAAIADCYKATLKPRSL